MHYVIRPESPSGKTLISLSDVDRIRGSWLQGVPLSTYMIEVPQPLRLKVDQDMPGDVLLDFYKVPVPIMTRKMADHLDSLGVDNLELFDVSTVDEETGDINTDCLAFNVVGLVAADAGKSVVASPPQSTGTVLDIEKPALDKGTDNGLEFFRLKESASTIVVSERMKESLEKESYTGLEFDSFNDMFSGIEGRSGPLGRISAV